MDEQMIARIAEKYKSLEPFLDERSKRVWAAAEAKALGRGGIIYLVTRSSRRSRGFDSF